jgi:uncharacterized protein (TIGR03083 family)
MEIAEHIAALEREGHALAGAAERAGLDAAVPTCPEWTVRDVLGHIGGVHRWATAHVAQTPDADADANAPLAEPPGEGLLDWYAAGHATLVKALRRAPDDLQCWTFMPAPTPLAFWARRQAHETAIHRADADAAVGQPSTYDPAFAADGIDELLMSFFARPRGRLVADPPVRLQVSPVDRDERWHVTVLPDKREMRRGEEAAECTVRGSASDLYLYLWNRPPVETPEAAGNARALELWRDLAQIRW